MILLLACTSPDPPKASGDDTATGEEIPTLAGCVVTGERTYFDSPGSSHWTETWDEAARIVATDEVTVYESGAAFHFASTHGFADDGCPDAWTSESQHASTDGDTIESFDTSQVGAATCDAHGAQDRREIAESHVGTVDGEIVSEGESTRVETVTNTWEDELLVETVVVADTGDSFRATMAYDADGRLVEQQAFDPADAETPQWVWTATYVDGELDHHETVLATGEVGAFDYERDTTGRVVRRVYTLTDGDDVDVDVVTYFYEDGWTWSVGSEEDEDADGDVDETETVSYDCP